nr:lipopolysaccharide biosynthesis protein [Butyricimonas paravirosa]
MIWTTLSTVVRSFSSLLQIVVLTKYLSKEDFGTVAIATLFIGFTQIFLDLGLSSGILYKQNITSKEYSSLFWLNIFTGVLLTLIICLITPVIAIFYRDPQLVRILSLLSLTILFSALGSQHRTVQQKYKRFKYISIIEIVSSLIAVIIAIVLADKGYGIYSLVYSTISNVFFSNLLFLIIGLVKDKNILFHFRLFETYSYLKIGVFSIGTQVFDYFSREIDTLIISTAFNREILGLYSLCKKLVVSLYGAITPIVTKVLTPLLSEIQNDIIKLRLVYYDIVQVMAITIIPLFCIVACFSEGIIVYLYGQQYVTGSMMMSLMAIYYGHLTTGTAISSLQIATGHTDSGFYWTIFRILINTIVISIGSMFSMNVMILILLIASFFSSPLSWKITVKPLIGGTFWEYFFKSFYPFCCSIFMIVPIYIFFSKETGVLFMLLMVAFYLILYIICSCILFKDSFLISKLNFLLFKRK